MALFWLGSALGILGFAALMLAIPPDDAQLLGEFPESYPNCDRKPRRRHSFFSARRYRPSSVEN